MKKKLFALLLAVAMVLTLAACGAEKNQEEPGQDPNVQDPAVQDPSVQEGTPDAEPQLSGTMKVVATSESYVTLFDKFTEETGVQVELLSMSSGEVLSKLRAEGGTPSADLWFGGGIDAFMGAKEDGLL